MNSQELLNLVKEMPIRDMKRIDVALEGNWNPTVTAVWSRERGFIGFGKVKKEHSKYKPSIELYFDDYWIGIHCYKRIKNKNIFDQEFALKIIKLAARKSSKA